MLTNYSQKLLYRLCLTTSTHMSTHPRQDSWHCPALCNCGSNWISETGCGSLQLGYSLLKLWWAARTVSSLPNESHVWGSAQPPPPQLALFWLSFLLNWAIYQRNACLPLFTASLKHRGSISMFCGFLKRTKQTTDLAGPLSLYLSLLVSLSVHLSPSFSTSSSQYTSLLTQSPPFFLSFHPRTTTVIKMPKVFLIRCLMLTVECFFSFRNLSPFLSSPSFFLPVFLLSVLNRLFFCFFSQWDGHSWIKPPLHFPSLSPHPSSPPLIGSGHGFLSESWEVLQSQLKGGKLFFWCVIETLWRTCSCWKTYRTGSDKVSSDVNIFCMAS